MIEHRIADRLGHAMRIVACPAAPPLDFDGQLDQPERPTLD
jgi:hypothetical protein